MKKKNEYVFCLFSNYYISNMSSNNLDDVPDDFSDSDDISFVEWTAEDEAKARNNKLIEDIAPNKLPSYCLWDAYSVGSPETWNSWWEKYTED